ncbi:MAG: Na+/H+ antiporter NhaC family protein [Firmicutes bacterium]|nr:Na+/H+ antiporter NhaC family protein [Bacillota bacterium]
MQKKGNLMALLPIAVFLVIFIGMGIATSDFYAMPAIVGFLIALVVAFAQNKELSFNEKFSICAKSVGDENILIMCLVFLAAGAFSGAVSAAGGVDSTVNLGLSLMPPGIAVVGLFIIGCFISTSMGTSVGTVTALTPIAVGVSNITGFDMAICVASVVSGAMFGDNLSMISDTTIAAVRTQGCEMKDKFKANFLIVLPAAILTVILYFVLTMGGTFEIAEDLSYNILQVLPYILVLVGALIGINVFVILIAGTVASLIVGIFTGNIAVMDIFSVVGGGVTSMYDITVISIVVAAIVGLVKENGGIQYIIDIIGKRAKGSKGGQLGIAALISLVDMATANNTVAIVMAGPIAKDISDEYGIPATRTASLLDIFASVFQGLIPYGAQLLTAAALSGLSPFDIIRYMYYPVLMAVSALLFICLGKSGKKIA